MKRLIPLIILLGCKTPEIRQIEGNISDQNYQNGVYEFQLNQDYKFKVRGIPDQQGVIELGDNLSLLIEQRQLDNPDDQGYIHINRWQIDRHR